MELRSHADIMCLWPTKAEFARAIGVSPANARNMHDRIPPKHFNKVVDAAERAGFQGVTYALLAELAKARASA